MSKVITLHRSAAGLRVLKRKPEDQAANGDEESGPSHMSEGTGKSRLSPGDPSTLMSELDQRLKDEYKAGFDDGRRYAEKNLRDEMTKTVGEFQQRTEKLVGSLETEYARFQQSAERSAVKLTLAIAARVVKREVILDDEFVVRQIHEATRRIVGVEKITIRVNPRDENFVRGNRTQITGGSGAIREFAIEADDTIEPGGCIVESDSGNVDASIATQLEKIEAALLDAHKDK